MMIPLLGRVGILSLSVGLAVPTPPAIFGPCDAFYEALRAVPHVSLALGTGAFISIWDGEKYDGCEVEFETNDSVRAGTAAPDFFADPGTDLYNAGWRMLVDIGADGAGSGIHGIQREAVLCIVRWEQPAYIDDDGKLVVSETLRMWIQCRDLPEPVRRSVTYD